MPLAAQHRSLFRLPSILSGILTWFFKSNLDDARKMAGQMVHQQLSENIEPLIKVEANNIWRSLGLAVDGATSPLDADR